MRINLSRNTFLWSSGIGAVLALLLSGSYRAATIRLQDTSSGR
jgi:hypothetical protein